ncbi:SPFH domain-containing protein [Streptomyces erythrochromogenes]|uniref:SPFH domain-containing protein n=1 Tax=Streptomyces erythrochromogenes TaxID=285574 RepID=A0ABZ1QF62_9ACTN|nr:SPFH domain-containing protein [Streptomyces erythrochromogenes]
MEPGDGAAPAVWAPQAVPLGTYASPRAAEPSAEPAPASLAVPARAAEPLETPTAAPRVEGVPAAVPAPAGEAASRAADRVAAPAPHAVPAPLERPAVNRAVRAAEPGAAPAPAPFGQAPPPATGPGAGGAPAFAGHGADPADGSARRCATAGAEGVPASGPAAQEPTAAAVPAARGESEPEPVHTTADSAPDSPYIPHPHPQHEDDERREEPDTAPDSGVPGPGVAEIVAQAVARAMEEGDTQDLPHVSAPHRGTAVTEVPVSLPFRAASTTLLPKREPAATPPPARPARPTPGRRVPRGDDRLREHRGPVLPGWVGVAVGGLALAGCTAVLWRAGAVPDAFAAAFGAAPRAYHGLRATHWPPLAFLGIVALVALGGLGRARTGHAWVLTLFGRYRGTVRRTGLTWVSPLLLRRRVDVRLRHWRSDPMPAVDSGGLALQVVVQVVWQVKDTARATLAVADHTEYLAEQVESAMARVLSQLPADAFHEDAPTLRDAEAVGDALTRMLAAETEAVGIEVFSAQPTRIEYAAEVAEAMRRRRVAAIDAKHRDTVLTSVVDAVDDTVHRLTSRGLVELDDYERKALVRDLTVAFCTGRTE